MMAFHWMQIPKFKQSLKIFNKSTTSEYTDSKEGFQAPDQKKVWQGSEHYLLKLKRGICDNREPLFWRHKEYKA